MTHIERHGIKDEWRTMLSREGSWKIAKVGTLMAKGEVDRDVIKLKRSPGIFDASYISRSVFT